MDINEMALDVYNATIDSTKRFDCEKKYGTGLRSKWYKLNELCMSLKPYYRVAKSNRKDIVTTLDKIYGSNLPMNVDFFQKVNSSVDDETQTMISSEPVSVQATKNCEEEPSGSSTIYDKDWLFLLRAVVNM